jgi:hypothetical protein
MAYASFVVNLSVMKKVHLTIKSRTRMVERVYLRTCNCPTPTVTYAKATLTNVSADYRPALPDVGTA